MLIQHNTDKQWELFGRKDPYFGVLTHNEFHKENLTEQSKEKFLKSGKEYVENVLLTIKQKIKHDFIPERVLDFGCGVGRLVMPFSETANYVTGIDVSDSMIAEAQKNCDDKNIKNVDFIKSNYDCSNIKGKYNLINSYIVFQHIPVKRGLKVFKNLLEHLDTDGICVVHFLFAKHINYMGGGIRAVAWLLEKYIPFIGNLKNLLAGRRFLAPRLQMNCYGFSDILAILSSKSITDIYLHGECHGPGIHTCMLYFKGAGR